MIREDELLRIISSSDAPNPSVAAVFDLNWATLDPDAQVLGCLLSLFAPTPIPWSLVEQVAKADDGYLNSDTWPNACKTLVQQHLLQSINEASYILHDLVRECFRAKLSQIPDEDKLRGSFCHAIVELAKTIPQLPNNEFIRTVTPFIPHIAEAAKYLSTWLKDEDLIIPFIGLYKYYRGLGVSSQAEPWLKECLSLVKSRLGETHAHMPTILHYLGGLYSSQGRLNDAEEFYLKALDLDLLLPGTSHVVTDLNSLAKLYQALALENFNKAESLYLKTLELCKSLSGKEQDSALASCLMNIASLYSLQNRYSEAEDCYKQSLDLWKLLVGEKHYTVAALMNNLAKLYESQGRYNEAEPLYRNALELFKELLGSEHKDVAQVMASLTELLLHQKRYKEAKSLLATLEVHESMLETGNSDTIKTREKIAKLYKLFPSTQE